MHRTSARPAPLNFPLPPAHSTYGIDRRKPTKLPYPPPQPTPEYREAPTRNGLRTPPADGMGTTYQPQQYENYSERQTSTYGALAAVGNGVAGSYSSTARQSGTYSAPTLSSASSTSTVRNDSVPITSQQISTSTPQTVIPNGLAPPEAMLRRKSANSDMILPNLQIPPSINNSGGSLAEFAAQITCLFWFESTETLRKAEQWSPSSSPIRPLREEAIPGSGFKKWVVTILSTTQVTQNVILLALLFIYRLKKANPEVKGRSGSEYRLMTVALMLGNKFLDDNTYTNKTWAEVSGISVTEIHVMEVEFLSNMRYSLLASEKQWKEWHEKLGRFWNYCDRASKAARSLVSPCVGLVHPLPSPPASMQSSPPALTRPYAPSPASFGYNQARALQGYTPSATPMAVSDVERLQSRKRSYVSEVEEPAAKRVTRSSAAASFNPQSRPDAPRLPVPNLTISTSQPMSNGYVATAGFAPGPPQLPPLTGRAMSTVYPTTPSWAPQLPLPSLTPNGLVTPHGPPSGHGYVTPSRRQSPHSVQELLALGSSPTTANFPGYNPGHISPSVFLQQRASPYKPIRHVNTLLYPPPSSSMQDYSANVQQMHYQPLGKRNDYRSGVVPDFASHPAYQQWPVLPQPNFHA